MNRNTKSTPKNMTIEDLAIIINDSFGRVDRRFDTVDTEIQGLKSQIRGIDSRIDRIAEDKVDRKEFDARLIPIEKKLAR